jgi:hypothetical protein
MRTKALSISSMFILLVVVIIVLPLIVKMVGYRSVQYFTDMNQVDISHLQLPASTQSNYGENFPMALPCKADKNGNVCPEGTFCDGSSMECVSLTVPSTISDPTGFFS